MLSLLLTAGLSKVIDDSAVEIEAGWIGYTLSSTLACTAEADLCHHMTHVVFWAKPTDPTKLFVGAGAVRYSEDAPWRMGGSVDFEQHYFSFNDDDLDKDRVQCYNFMFEEVFLPSELGTENRTQAWVKVFIQDGDRRTTLELGDPIAVKSYVEDNAVADNYAEDSWYHFGNSTVECPADEREDCRFNAHVVFKHATTGDPLQLYGGGGMLSFDKGETWEEESAVPSWGVAFERALVFGYNGNDLTYQGSNWGTSTLVSREQAETLTTVCAKVWVVDKDDDTVSWVPMDGGSMGYMLSKYVRCYDVELHVWEE